MGREPAEEGEEKLTGGTSPGVMRIGDTVRRPAGPWTDTIDTLLRHLEGSGFPASKTRGRDAQGRQVLTWVPGTTTWDEHARHWRQVDSLRKAGQLARWLHDLLDEFDPPKDAVWRGGWGRSSDTSGPICHWDLAPYNVVASPTGQLAVIDWDGAGPGDRLSELAYATDSFALLRRDSECARLGYLAPPPRVPRIEAFVAGYGLPEGRWGDLADALIANARDRLEFGVQMHREGREPYASWWRRDNGAGDKDDLALTERVVREWRPHQSG